MAEPTFLLKYDGGDADTHTVDMRLLGRSLIGFDRIVSDGVVLITQNRLPRRGERGYLRVRAYQPAIGSTEVPFDLAQYAHTLPLAWWLLQTGAGEIVGHWVSFVLSMFGGRKSAAEESLKVIERLREIEARERLASDAMWHEQVKGFRDRVFDLLDRLAVPAANAVAPVGPSVRSVDVRAGDAPPLHVDEPMADAIRAKGELEVSDLLDIDLRVDGFVHHSRKLNVEHPYEPGVYISADVRDPSFDSVPNVYTAAAANKAVIRVKAKLATRAGRIERIYIMDYFAA